MKRGLLKTYNGKQIFWIIRCNLVVFRDIRSIEFTFGLLGYGILAQWSYRKDPVAAFNKRREDEEAAEETEHDWENDENFLD